MTSPLPRATMTRPWPGRPVSSSSETSFSPQGGGTPTRLSLPRASRAGRRRSAHRGHSDEIGQNRRRGWPRFSRSCDVVFTWAAVGPTHDGRHHRGIARAFGCPWCADPAMVAALEGFYGAPHPAGIRMANSRGRGADDRPTVSLPRGDQEERPFLPGVPELFRRKVRGAQGALPRRTVLSGQCLR